MENPTLNNSAVPLYDLLYVGHSMGTTMSFVMLSLRPEYNEKIQAAFALAPVAYMSKVKSPIRLLAPFSKDIQVQLNIYIYMHSHKLSFSVMLSLCTAAYSFVVLC